MPAFEWIHVPLRQQMGQSVYHLLIFATVPKVLCGLIEPDAGKVMVDGQDIRQLGVNNYHKMIACVMQDDRLFSGSIRENISGFTENIDEAWMTECANASFIHETIMKMPMGMKPLLESLGKAFLEARSSEFLLLGRCIVSLEYYSWMRLQARLTLKVKNM